MFLMKPKQVQAIWLNVRLLEVLTGGVGAVVGGATARKETTVKQENDKIIHDYTVIININSLSEPIVKIPLGTDGTKVNEIVGLMNVIISRKK